MKRIVFTTSIVLFLVLTSCKDATKKEVNSNINEAKNEIESVGNSVKEGYKNTKEEIYQAFNDIEIPDFEDEKAAAYLKDYANHIKKKVGKGVDELEDSEFVKETTKLAERSEQIVKNLDDKAKKQFNETKAEIDAKWNEWEKEVEAETNH